MYNFFAIDIFGFAFLLLKSTEIVNEFVDSFVNCSSDYMTTKAINLPSN